MKTHLIFKRQETIDGTVQVVTKIIPVDVPYINRGEGWILQGHADVVDVITEEASEVVSLDLLGEPIINETNEEPSVNVTKFQCNVTGTAKLVRSKGAIKIVSRRGKTTYNQTTPNSVCINDFTKNEFFKSCREKHGNAGIFEFKPTDGTYYDYWNNIIDKEYQRQKNIFMKGNNI